ncbi:MULTISPECIES: flagellar biosynthesis anti-sigma factor FlgM [Kluyvera]|nr:flagellar biosynthesis anti-sigma factor FlgM [Kluyvera intermedia]WEJ83559.1 MAG: flagellar biosynthesis anti-sigma factor FlgM [Kluyvera intermedia]
MGSQTSARQGSYATKKINENEGSAMKVAPTQYNLTTAINKASSAEQTRTVAPEGTSVTRSAAIDPVLGDAQTQLSTLPEVDMARVAEMKDAISSGKISINVDSLTDAMQKYFQR